MIEIVYQNGANDATEEEGYFHIPKNIRQIGEIQEERKIYIEDYVYTYLNKEVQDSLGVGRIAILLGSCKRLNSITYIFIKSGFFLEKTEISMEHIELDDAVWAQIYTIIKEKFPKQEIIGWFLSLPDFKVEVNNSVFRTHVDHFSEEGKILYAMDSIEKEENFYFYENGQMEKQKGYYIYYEKNEEMQQYLIEHKQSVMGEGREQLEDKAVKNFRRIVKNQIEQKSQKRNGNFVYGAGICLTAAALVVGILFLQNHKNLKSMEEVLKNVNVDGEKNEETAGVLAEGQSAQNQTTQTAITDAQNADARASENQSTEKQDSETRDTASQDAKTQDASSGDAESQGAESHDAKTENTVSQDAETQNASSQNVESQNKGTYDGSVQSAESQDTKTQNTVSQDAKTQEAESKTSESEKTSAQALESDTAKTEAAQSYVVKKGDTLSGICETYYGSVSHVEDICNYNNIGSKDLIYPGQIILLP